MNKIHPPNIPRILHFVPGFRMGGIESLLMSLYRGLDKTEMQFDFMVDTVDDLPEFKEIRDAGGRVFQMGRYLDNPIKYQIQVEKIFGKYSSEYIALHSHTVIRALPILLSASRHGISKRIIHSHTDSLQNFRYKFIVPSIAEVTTMLATEYWACSNNAAKLFFENKPFEILNNAIPTSKFAFSINQRKKTRELLGFKENDLVIGHTGRFTYQKNHEYLVRVFSKALQLEKNAKLLLVGEGPLIESIKKLASDLGVINSISFVGSQPNIPAYLSAMDIFFMPSHYEGLPLSLIEAQANGLKCLISDVITKEVHLTPSITTFSFKAKESEVASKLINVTKKGRGNSTENRSYIIDRGFDTDSQIARILELYRK